MKVTAEDAEKLELISIKLESLTKEMKNNDLIKDMLWLAEKLRKTWYDKEQKK